MTAPTQHDWTDLGGGLYFDRATGQTFNVRQELHAVNSQSAPPPARTDTVTPPYNPNQQIFAGYANNQYIDDATAKQLLASAVPDLVQNEQVRAQLHQYIDAVTQGEGYVTPQRIGEISLAARTALSGTPDQIARQKMVETGHALPFEKLPAPVADNFRKLGVSEEDAAETLKIFYPDLSPQQRLEKFVAATQLPDAAQAPGWAQPRGGAGQLSPEQVAALKNRSLGGTPSVAQHLDGSMSVRGLVYGQDG